jgi:hypothetical protein
MFPRLFQGKRLRWTATIVAGALLSGICFAAIPRRANLRGFDPTEIARLETGMWRDYYQHKRLPLVLKLYSTSRDQYGFSPLDSARLAWLAGKAAIVFKDSKSDDEADQALPPLRQYFDLINRRSGSAFDVDRATKLELEWWKIRRHHVGTTVYGHVVSEATAVLYGTGAVAIEPYGQLRAAAMDYRDVHGEQMTDKDWAEVERMLVQAYGQLKQTVLPPASPQ